MALVLLIGGIVMWVVDAWSVRRDLNTRDVEQMTDVPGDLDWSTGGDVCGFLPVSLDRCQRLPRGKQWA